MKTDFSKSACRCAAMTLLTRGSPHDGLIALRRLLFVVLYEEDGNRSPQHVRVAGYGARRIPWGVRCGGARNCRFDRNASLRPRPRARGWRVDARQRGIVRTADRLKKALATPEGAAEATIESQLRLPDFWAGFAPRDVDRVAGDGPELLGEVHTTGRGSADLLADRRREFNGLVLFPLPWVSHAWESFRAVYVDLDGFPKVQVVALTDPAQDLRGFRAACEFDFYSSRFREDGNVGGGKRSRAAVSV